jgi:hypothetical protein
MKHYSGIADRTALVGVGGLVKKQQSDRTLAMAGKIVLRNDRQE